MLETSDKTKIARSAGWTQAAEPTPVETEQADTHLLDPSDTVRPERVAELRTFWSRPVPRALALAVPTAGVLFLLVSLFTGHSAQDRQASLPSSNLTPEDPQAERISELEEQVEDYKVKSALESQSNNLKGQPKTAKVVPTPSPARPFSSSTSPTSVAVTRSPRPVPVAPPVAPAYAPRRVETVTFNRPLSSPPISQRSQPQTRWTPVSAEDPMEEWLAAANLGSYGSVSGIDSSSSYQSQSTTTYAAFQGTEPTALENHRQLDGGSGEAPSTIASKSYAKVEDSDFPNVDDSSSLAETILLGTRATAVVETPITWTGNLQNPNQIFLIRLTEPLRGADGEAVLPEGTYIEAQVIEASNGGYLQMSALSARIRREGQSEKLDIPSGSVLVLGEGGGLLKADARSANEVGSDLWGSILSGVSTAAGLFNRPTSQTFSDFGGSTNYGQPDYLAGFFQGATQSMVQSIQQQNQQARSLNQSQPVVFVLDTGREIQIYVNEDVTF